jgi:hypothetical protein
MSRRGPAVVKRKPEEGVAGGLSKRHLFHTGTGTVVVEVWDEINSRLPGRLPMCVA